MNQPNLHTNTPVAWCNTVWGQVDVPSYMVYIRSHGELWSARRKWERIEEEQVRLWYEERDKYNEELHTEAIEKITEHDAAMERALDVLKEQIAAFTTPPVEVLPTSFKKQRQLDENTTHVHQLRPIRSVDRDHCMRTS